MNNIKSYYTIKKACLKVDEELYKLCKIHAYSIELQGVVEVWVSQAIADLRRRVDLTDREKTLLLLLLEAEANGAQVIRVGGV